MTRLLGIDVGGTFTDLFFLNEETGEIAISKASTTPGNQAVGLFNAMKSANIEPAGIDLLIHGTTIATNALIERRGAKCGLITTRGFRDLLEMGRRDRPHLYGLGGLQKPLLSRDACLEVTERMNAYGEMVTELDEAGVRSVALKLVQKGVQAIVIGFLHSYANPAHERRAAEIVRDACPDVVVNLSSELSPQMFEFERFSTAVIHTYLQPEVSNYVTAMKARLQENGYKNDVLFVQSSGGIMSSAMAKQRPANLALSGPAAGVTAASYIARVAGYENVISADMGGTSFDVCLIPGGRPRTTQQAQIDFRLPLRVSMIDIQTVGAGGGSIAWIDRAGLLQIGPESAGGYPGPAAYGRGGDRPTVTDANLVLGRINPGFVLGGEGGMKMDRDAAARVILRDIGEPLGIDLEQAALAIIQMANNSMAGRTRVVSIEKGYDPRDFALVAYGGAGPLHAGAIMREVGIGRCVIPYYPGVLCALGSAAADLRQDISRTVMQDLDSLDYAEFRTIVDNMVVEGEDLIRGEGVPVERIDVLVSADMSYEGQRHNIRVNLPAKISPQTLREAFDVAYTREYRQTLDSLGVRMTALHMLVVGVRRPLNVASWLKQRKPGIQAKPETRSVYFAGEHFETAIHQRVNLGFGSEIFGPAIIEQTDTTTVVDPGLVACVDEQGNIILTEVK